MTSSNVLPYAAFLLAIIALWKPVGGYMARVFERQWTWPDPLLLSVERAVYRVMFSELPDASTFVGGAFIVAGGVIVSGGFR